MYGLTPEDKSTFDNKNHIDKDVIEKVTKVVCELFGYDYEAQQLVTISRDVVDVKYIVWLTYKKKLGYKSKVIAEHFGRTVKSINLGVRSISRKMELDKFMAYKLKILWEML